MFNKERTLKMPILIHQFVMYFEHIIKVDDDVYLRKSIHAKIYFDANEQFFKYRVFLGLPYLEEFFSDSGRYQSLDDAILAACHHENVDKFLAKLNKYYNDLPRLRLVEYLRTIAQDSSKRDSVKDRRVEEAKNDGQDLSLMAFPKGRTLPHV